MKLAPSIESELRRTSTAFREQLIECCRRLIQIPSVNAVHDEAALAETIAHQAERLGLHVQLAHQAPRRPNVIISTSDTGPTGLLLLGHLDTVPAGDEGQWTYSPFSGTVANGRLYGRGAIDTKGGMASALYALAALAHTPGALPAGRVQLICVPDEESGATGDLGIKFLHSQGLLSGLGAIYAYSGDEINLGHRGLVRYRLKCRGEAIHTGAEAWQDKTAGSNAVTGMARLLVALENLSLPYSKAKYFERFKTIITPGTVISGGTSVNIVPDSCEALVDVRLTPEFDLQATNGLLDDCIASVQNPRLAFSYDILNAIPATIADETAPIFQITEQVIADVKGVRPRRTVAGPANEGYLLIERDIPTICGLGPSGANAHAVDEYVEIEGLIQAATIFSLTAHRLSQHMASEHAQGS
jgi:acetylornithine deacetylase/succinyl-diaminopimelate desuccinylase-like protein